MKKIVLFILMFFFLAGAVYAGSTTVSIAAAPSTDGAWSGTENPKERSKGAGQLNMSISGTWAGTVFLQRTFDNGATYVDVESYTGNTEKVIFDDSPGVKYRLGIKSGGYTSGTAVLGLYW